MYGETEYLIIDIETIPDDTAGRPEFDETTVKTGNLKDPVKIQAKIAEAKEAWESGLNKQLSLDVDYCRIISIGVIHTDRYFNEIERAVFINAYGDDTILRQFFTFCRGIGDFTLIGWNSKWFDLPIIFKRAVLQDIEPYFGGKTISELTHPYQNHSIDLKKIWAPEDRYYKLSSACKRFGIPIKTGMDGSMIYQAYKEQRFLDIENYNTEDCEATLALAAKLLKFWY